MGILMERGEMAILMEWENMAEILERGDKAL